MPPVFAHGRLRLYLLKLLDEAPRHGYEIIRLLEERFQGLYAPSAGTVYPRLAKLEAEGLVTHATEGGRKVYSITDAGRAEVADRGGELADLELEIRESVAELAAEIREDVRGSANDLRREVREATRQARGTDTTGGEAWTDKEAWKQAKEEMRRAKDEWKEQARRAKEESRRARQEAQRARKQARDAQDLAREEVQRMARRVQEQTQEHLRAGDWQRAMREGLAEVSRSMSRLSRQGGWDRATAEQEFTVEREDSGYRAAGAPEPGPAPEQPDASDPTRSGTGAPRTGDRLRKDHVDTARPADAGDRTTTPTPDWAADPSPTGNPARDLDRLLDRFRDDVRDAARDHGVTDAQLSEARHHLATTATRLTALLRGEGRG